MLITRSACAPIMAGKTTFKQTGYRDNIHTDGTMRRRQTKKTRCQRRGIEAAQRKVGGHATRNDEGFQRDHGAGARIQAPEDDIHQSEFTAYKPCTSQNGGRH